MDKLISFISANAQSWTVRLGVLAAILVAVANAVPSVQAAFSAVWPAADAWFVVFAMWLGRAIGFIRSLESVAGVVPK